MRDADDDELARYAIDRARIDAELARLNGPAIPDPNKTDEEFEAELAQFRAFAEEFGAFTKAFDEDGIPRGDRAGSFANAAGGSADDANAKMVAEFKAAVMKGDADYGATGSRDDDPRVVRARVEGADGDGDGVFEPGAKVRVRRGPQRRAAHRGRRIVVAVVVSSLRSERAAVGSGHGRRERGRRAVFSRVAEDGEIRQLGPKTRSRKRSRKRSRQSRKIRSPRRRPTTPTTTPSTRTTSRPPRWRRRSA